MSVILLQMLAFWDALDDLSTIEFPKTFPGVVCSSHAYGNGSGVRETSGGKRFQGGSSGGSGGFGGNGGEGAVT